MARQAVTFAICLALLVASCDKSFAQDDPIEDVGDDGGEEYGGGGMDDYGGGGGYGGGYGDDYGGGGGGGNPGADESVPGVVDLDDNTFGKIIDGRHHVFLVFYGAYDDDSLAFHTELQTIGEELGAHKSLLLAKVNADVNDKLVAEFNAGETFPVLLYLAKGTLEPTKYEGERTASAVMAFITGFTGEVGTVDALKPLVDEFMTSSAKASNRAQMELEVSKLAENEASYGAYYLKLAKKVIENGDGFVKTEFERLQRMIVSGSLRPDKEAEFKLRCAVLKVFSREKLENFASPEEEDMDEAEHEEL
mmetsp:Transcript_33458/g.46348  ORF Transcript_33458/g.46348 Transcript_33458/m.46348 type:complete len:307 (+) Transcript_33458:81-1001(+)